MFGNLLKSTIRNLARERLLALFSIGGLAIAFASAVFIALFIYDKFHAESFIPENRRIFLLGTTLKMKNMPPMAMPFSAPEAGDIVRRVSGNVALATRRIRMDDVPVSHQNIRANESVNWVDPNFFAMFQMPVLRGDAEQALASPDSAAVTATFARKYFGTLDAVGQVVTLNLSGSFKIAAVLEDLPVGSSLAGGLFISSRSAHSPFTPLEAARAGAPVDLAMTAGNYTYLLLANRADQISVKQAIDGSDQLRSRYPEMMSVGLSLVALNDLRLRMPGRPDTSAILIGGLALVGLLVVAVSGINFVNLMTARANRRAKEIAIRRVEGATRQHIVLQFFGETLLVVCAATLVGIALVELSAPYWEKLLSAPFRVVDKPLLLAGMLGFALLFAIVAASYPALVLSSVPPQSALKQSVSRGGGSRIVREILVTAQFAFVIGTLIATIVMTRQVEFATRDVMRFPSDRTLVLDSKCATAFADEIRKLASVDGTFCSSAAPMRQFSVDIAGAVTKEGAQVTVSGMSVDFNFFQFYQIKPLAGRLFDPRYGSDRLAPEGAASVGAAVNSVIVNESGARRLGFVRPADALGVVARGLRPGGGEGRIVGVVPDFIIGPVYEEIRPLVFFVDPGHFQHMSVKLSDLPNPEVMGNIERVWRRHHQGALFRPVFLDQHLNAVYRDIIVEMVVFRTLSLVILAIAGIGLLALSILSLQDRLKEVGVRKVMGASRLDIAKLLSVQFARPVLMGALIACPVAYVGSRYWLQGFVHHIDVSAAVLLLSTGLTVIVACSAVMAYSWLSANADPIHLLRYE